MFTNKARIAIIDVLLILSAFAWYYKVWEIALFGLLMCALILWGYFKEGPIILAAKHYKNKEYQKAKELLLSIKKPNWLAKKRKPYYEFLLGCIAVQQLNYADAALHLGKAAVLGLRAHDLVTALMHLANISLRNKEKENGLVWINQSKKLKLNAKQQSVLNNIEKELQLIK